MKVTILTDNMAGPRFIATHGFSCYIEADINVLFDTGPDTTYIENAKRLNLNLKPDYIVLSHGHWDHGNGLEFFTDKVKLLCHPACFSRRYSKVKDRYVGLSLNSEDIGERFVLKESKEPVYLSKSVIYLGEIPRLNDFEAQQTDFVDDKGSDDFIFDDSAIVIRSGEGLIIISGCAHAGICNTIEYAKKITGINKVEAVFGGFHLKSQGEQTIRTINYLQKSGITKVFPSHCTSLPALSKFYNSFKTPQVLTGNYYTF